MSRIIFLHGPSSSGKSTLADATLAQSPTPFLKLSFDTFRDTGALAPQHFAHWRLYRAQVFKGLHQCFAGFAGAGCDLIIEHILDTEGWHAELKELLAGHRLVFVGLTAPLDVLQTREAARGDRPKGSAVEDAKRVHLGMSYDLWIDGTEDPQTSAARVLDRLNEDLPSQFFTKA